ncbi:MAG: double zinc ribbon domain-containing protein, partial [Odoribacter sp.]|nr:double zinc ribbon domain-containing protein [Odoribacter sp.]
MEMCSWNRIKCGCREVLSGLVDLVYPPGCEVCGKSLVQSEKYLCTDCLADFPFVDRNFIVGEDVLEQFEPSCRPEQLFALFYYDKYGDYKNLVHLVKYHGYRKLGVWLGRMLGEQMKSDCRADCIVPIPLHKKRERRRGFNQALEIARGINDVLHIELLENAVERVRNNVSQTGKNAAERLKNVENIFRLTSPEKI